MSLVIFVLYCLISGGISVKKKWRKTKEEKEEKIQISMLSFLILKIASNQTDNQLISVQNNVLIEEKCMLK